MHPLLKTRMRQLVPRESARRIPWRGRSVFASFSTLAASPMKQMIRWSSVMLLPLTLSAAEPTPPPPEPNRIVIECEDMRGVAQDKFGPGAGWQVGRWGQDLYQNSVRTAQPPLAADVTP